MDKKKESVPYYFGQNGGNSSVLFDQVDIFVQWGVSGRFVCLSPKKTLCSMGQSLVRTQIGKILASYRICCSNTPRVLRGLRELCGTCTKASKHLTAMTWSNLQDKMRLKTCLSQKLKEYCHDNSTKICVYLQLFFVVSQAATR